MRGPSICNPVLAATLVVTGSVVFPVASCSDNGKKKVGVTLERCAPADDGLTRCNVNQLETCSTGSWRFTRDCALTGDVCQQVGLAQAFACLPPQPICNNLEWTLDEAFFDAELLELHYGQALLSDTTGDRLLVVENWPDYGGVAPGTSGSIDISDGHTNYDDCGVCVYAVDDSGVDTRVLFAQGGLVTISMPSATGEDFGVAIQGLELREVDPDDESYSTLIAGGSCATSEMAQASVASGHWPCDAYENDAATPLGSGGVYCEAATAQGQYQLLSCTGDCDAGTCTVAKSIDCDANSTTCSTADNATFVAHCP